jgi:hypothetical protein
MLRKVISGGQTGADIAGLEAAVRFGIEPGGWCPPGYIDENGPNMALRAFGLKQIPLSSSPWKDRTRKNVLAADATILFGNPLSSGGKCAIAAVHNFRKPMLIVSRPGAGEDVSPQAAAAWITENSVSVLNVAGNRESSNPGMHDIVYGYLCQVFVALGHKEVPCPPERS